MRSLSSSLLIKQITDVATPNNVQPLLHSTIMYYYSDYVTFVILLLLYMLDSCFEFIMAQSRGVHKIKDECTLYVTVKGSKLPDDINKRHLLQHFREFNSSIIDVELVHKKEKRYAFIKFVSGDTATAAMQSLQGSMLAGRYLLTINYGQKTVSVTEPEPEPQPQPQQAVASKFTVMSTCSMVSPPICHGEYSQSDFQCKHSQTDSSIAASNLYTREKYCSWLL